MSKDSSLCHALVIWRIQARSTEARIDGDIIRHIPTRGDPRVSPQFVFSRWPVRKGTLWTPQRVAWVGLLMALDEGQTLGARFEHSCETAHALHPHWSLGEAYSGFAAAVVRIFKTIAPGMVKRLQLMVRELAGTHWTCCRWPAFAVDGTRIETGHTIANENGLGCAGREKSAPQVFLTTLYHMGTGLPWDFRVGPGTDSERRHLEDMLDSLPEGALAVADAGFVGYETCWRILNSNKSFLLRVGSNITLLKELGYYEERDGLIYLWPQAHRDKPPLVLRLIVLQHGKQTVYLVTNVLDPAALTDEEAGILYKMRWGIEVFYRSYKQTLDRRKMLSRKPETCLAEAQCTILGIWLLGLLSVRRLINQGITPRAFSVAKARNAIRKVTRRVAAHRSHRRELEWGLRSAILDKYKRRGPKAARNYPRKKQEKPPGAPKIRKASAAEIKRAAKLRERFQRAA